ncbi:hypothetical protein KGF54_000003, partial [Candida jiufengensis]|uniref:uncharacterized protein n=1 Tax=Candida jiufengensis TaxID=497108 RepID=UPI0022259398
MLMLFSIYHQIMKAYMLQIQSFQMTLPNVKLYLISEPVLIYVIILHIYMTLPCLKNLNSLSLLMEKKFSCLVLVHSSYKLLIKMFF